MSLCQLKPSVHVCFKMIYRHASSFFLNIPRNFNLVCTCSIFLHNWKKTTALSMVHSSRGFDVVEDNERQLGNHMELRYRIIDGAVARPLADVVWVWYKNAGSSSGILQKSLFFFFLENWNKANFVNGGICKRGEKFLQKFSSFVLLLITVLW